ncbi:helix-turn-helix domain-containing protein [Sphingomonas sp. G124]|uniref:Helix-turn-helix domain-containing protein n=2 Tax=Sphingomonas cremea TaxID=2904799 RepID=A0A9X1QKY9_9SPHN|nr:helix-turn-helix domain-containing protein [Sphingomonas cremea]
MAARAGLSASERLVLLVLRFHQAENPIGWPSQSTLAQETGMSERSVRRALIKLRQSGLIQITESIGKVSAYSITLTPVTVSGVGSTKPRTQRPATPAKWNTKPRPPCPPNKEGIKKEKRSDAPRLGFESPLVASEPSPLSAEEFAAVAEGFAELLGRKSAKADRRDKSSNDSNFNDGAASQAAHLSAVEQAQCQADPIRFWAEQERLAAAKSEAGQ